MTLIDILAASCGRFLGFTGSLALAILIAGCGERKVVGALPETPSPSPIPTQPTLGRNLIINGDAENVVLNEKDTKDVPSIWKRSPEVLAIEYSGMADEFTGGNPACPDGRKRYFRFALAIHEEGKSISQLIAAEDAAPQIDSGQVECALGGWFGGWVHGDASAMLEVDFLNATGAKLGTLATEAPDPAALPKPETARAALVKQTAVGPVPSGTRRLEVRLTALRPTKNIDTNAVAAADNVSLVLRQKGHTP